MINIYNLHSENFIVKRDNEMNMFDIIINNNELNTKKKSLQLLIIFCRPESASLNMSHRRKKSLRQQQGNPCRKPRQM